MTQKHFITAAAEIVRNIENGRIDGRWTYDPPSWATDEYGEDGCGDYTHAVQTAEAFIVLFQSFNLRFDQAQFLVACGLQKGADV